MKQLDRVAPWLAGAVLSLPLFIAYYPPMVDLSLHEAVVSILRHWGDPRYVPPNVYELNIGQANQLFYFIILPFAYLLPMGIASKTVAGITVLLFPVCVARVADHMRVSRIAAILLAPLGMGWMFFWGLLGNMMAINAYLWALPSFDRFCQKPDGRGLAKACGWIILLHFLHGLIALIGGGTLMLLSLLSWRKWRDWSTYLLPFIPPVIAVALAITSWNLSKTVTSLYHRSYAGIVWMPFEARLNDVVDSLYTATDDEPYMRYVILIPCQIPVLYFAVERFLYRSRTKRAWRDWLFHFRFEILGLVFLASYFIVPTQIHGVTRLNPRFLCPAWILLTLGACAKITARRPWVIPRWLAVVAPFVPLLIIWPTRFMDTDRTYRGLDEALGVVEPGSSYNVLHIGTVRPYQFDCLGADGHVVGEMGGRTYFDYTLSEGAAVHMRVQAQWDSIFERVGLGNSNWMPNLDLKRYRYVLLHATKDPDLLQAGVRAMQPEGRVIYNKGEWAVLESTLGVLPLDAPDTGTPNPPPITLQQRFNLLSQGHGPPTDQANTGPAELPPMGM